MHNYFSILWSIHTILESLPISSSGHMRLITCYLQKCKKIKLPEEPEYLTHFMHLTTALIISVFLLVRLIPELINIHTLDDTISMGLVLTLGAGSIFIANSITAIFYFLFRRINIRSFPLWLGFLVTSLLLLSLNFVPSQVRDASFLLTYGFAFIIGIAQGLSLLPGISRMATTFVVARWCGIEASAAFLYSLALQLPLIFAALAKSFYLIFIKKMAMPVISKSGLLLLSCATVISYGILQLVYCTAQHDYFAYFGWYMLIPVFISYYLRGSEK